ncbi:unnamed protein product [Allacma fusca]|uniref:Uncharacterized protein n=1 Tax=Allacma fusca TaxID=39272 RepID=A0A8J2KXD6_9HEXA|nr:unnamed protein product [Allacma fusca]
MATLTPTRLLCCLTILLLINSGADGNSPEVRAFGSPSLEMMIAHLKKSKPLSARSGINSRHPQSVLIIPQPTVKPLDLDMSAQGTRLEGLENRMTIKNRTRVNRTRLRQNILEINKKQGHLVSSNDGYSSELSDEENSYESEEESEESETPSPQPPKKKKKTKLASSSITTDPAPGFKSMKIKDYPTNFLNLVGTDFQPYRLVNIFLVLVFMMYMLVTQGYMMWVYGLSFRGGQSIIQGIPGYHFLQTSLANVQAALASSSTSNTLGLLGLLAGAPLKIIDSDVWEYLQDLAVDTVDETFLFLEENIPEANNVTLSKYFGEVIEEVSTFLDTLDS